MNKKFLMSFALLVIGSQNFITAKKNKSVVITNIDGTTSLIEAVKTSSYSRFKKSLKFDDVNFVDTHGKTAMDYAIEHNKKKFVFELSKQRACITTDSNRIAVTHTIQHKINTFKGAGITWLLAGPAALIGGSTLLIRRGTWKTIADFYKDPKASLV